MNCYQERVKLFMSNQKDISDLFKPNMVDSEIVKDILGMDNISSQLKHFIKKANNLTDYAYWHILSVLWIANDKKGVADIWKTLFSSDRLHREKCIMKPSEYKAFSLLPYKLTAYRVHHEKEGDWMSLTLNPLVAEKFANIYKAKEIREYTVKKRYVLALFLRRMEDEILVLDNRKAKLVAKHEALASWNRRSGDDC